jgi:hypothetical protein
MTVKLSINNIKNTAFLFSRYKLYIDLEMYIDLIINCHAKHETEDLQMDIHLGLGVLATGNRTKVRQRKQNVHRRRRLCHTIIRPQNFCGRIKII